MKNWILVANSSRARLFSTEKVNAPWNLEQELEHPESRAKNMDLVSDKPGRQQQSASGGTNRPAMSERTEPKEAQAELFARELADVLEKGWQQGHCESIVLVAPPHFLGLLRGALSGQCDKRVHHSVVKDYTQHTVKQLMEEVSWEDAE